jgi:uracil-DNA glycosylase family protein
MGAEEFFPGDATNLRALRDAAAGCKGCALFERATQTVFGDGDPNAEVMMVGEQPGDREDVEGIPFVGPAGRLLDKAMAEAGIDRERVYVTNAVKHFKWEPHGDTRLHTKPSSREIAACSAWLDAEIESVRPEIVVCLGATAAQALLGSVFRVTRQRGSIMRGPHDVSVLATAHPASVLRAPDEKTRSVEREHLVEDLRRVAEFVA